LKGANGCPLGAYDIDGLGHDSLLIVRRIILREFSEWKLVSSTTSSEVHAPFFGVLRAEDLNEAS